MPSLPTPDIIILYAGILGLIGIGTAVLAGRLRGGENGVAVGDGGRMDVLIAMRRHANFAEWVPLALVLMGLLEMNGVSDTAIHVMGGALVVGRLCHAVGFDENASNPLRAAGAGLTVLPTAVASVWCIVAFF